MIRSFPFTGECTAARDDQETINTFYTSSGLEALSISRYDLDLNTHFTLPLITMISGLHFE
ncbi:MAG: hypothetical protein OEY93_00100 [Anaerolineae bacterium]|nr:hypothetical protein [Anaerolineae bacterium]